MDGLIPPGCRHPGRTLRTREDSLRVLLVEDSRDFAQVVCSTLGHADHGSFEIVHADALEDALDQLTRDYYDALLLDLGQPEQRAERIEAASSMARNLPVIVLTGTRDDHLMQCVCGAEDSADDAEICLVRAALADTILQAVKQYRRFGQIQPVFCRVTN